MNRRAQTRTILARTSQPRRAARLLLTLADYAKSLKKGDYVEIEGELRSTEYDAEVGEGKKKTTVKRRGWEIRASIVKKLAQPASQGTENPDADPITEDDAA